VPAVAVKHKKLALFIFAKCKTGLCCRKFILEALDYFENNMFTDNLIKKIK